MQTMNDRDTAIKRIKTALQRRSGKTWSVSAVVDRLGLDNDRCSAETPDLALAPDPES